MGLGVVPSAWPTNNDYKAIQVGSGACIFGRGSGDEDRGGIGVNYYGTTSGAKYITNGHAARIYMADGNIYLQNAASNSSGADAAMTLNTRLHIGTDGTATATGTSDGVLQLDTSDSRGAFIRFGQGGSYHHMVGCADGLVAGPDKEDLGLRAADNMVFCTNGANEKLRIDSNGRVSLNDNSRPASDANEGAQLRVTGAPLTRNQYYSPAGHYYGSFGYTDNTYTKSWIAVDSSYAKSSAVSAGIFLSAFHQDAGGSTCGFTIKNLKDGNPLVFSSVKTAASVGNPAVEEERVRINHDGRVGINTTLTEMDGVTGNLNIANDNFNNHTVINLSRNTASDRNQIRFSNPNGNVGSIDTFNSDLMISSGNALKFRTNGNERVSVNSSGMVVFKGGSGNVDQVKIESQGGGTGLYIANFQGVDAGDSSSRLGVGKNDNVLLFTNASGSQISNFAIGNTDSIPLVLSTSNKRRFEITGPGIAIFHDNQGTYTNTVQSHSGEAAFITHYTARTTSGSDRYRRMLDIASGGANPHGSSIRFLTSDDNTNPATCVERMRILNNGGVFIGNKSHNQNYPHIESPGLLTVQDGARVDTTANVFAAPKGGFCDQARYNLESQLISISNSNVGICQARNGQSLAINDARSSWSYFANLPNYLLGHAATDCINNTDFTLELYADMTVFLLRSNGWNGISNTYNFSQDWHLIEQDTDIDPAGANTRLYVTTVPRGSYSWDNNSAMYFFIL